MNTVTMKNVEFGAGVPKICVPICGKSKEDVLEQAKIIIDTPVILLNGVWIGLMVLKTQMK